MVKLAYRVHLRQFEYFDAVARSGSFRRAATALSVTEPALSQGIKQLETELGLILLERSRRGVRMTPAGEILLTRARRVVREIEAARREMAELAGLKQGSLIIGALTSATGIVNLPALLASFNERHPGLDLQVQQHRMEALIGRLLAGEVDVGLILQPHGGADVPEEVELVPIFVTELRAVVRPDHPLAANSSVQLSQLADQRLILNGTGSGSRLIVWDEMARLRLRPRVAPIEVTDAAMAVGMVAEGLGVGFATEPLVRRVDAELRTLAIQGVDCRLDGLLIMARYGARTPAIRAFIELARAWPWGASALDRPSQTTLARPQPVPA
jgi:LysR family transcriptional activator of glutamate synthase operon